MNAMKFAGTVAFAAAAAVCGGCSGLHGAVPVAENPGALPAQLASQSLPASAQFETATTSSPCDLPAFWYFRGSCSGFGLPPSGETITLAAYDGIKLSIAFPSNASGKSVPFMVGDGTSRKNITGTFHNRRFPVYGSIPCYDTSGRQQACAGAAFLYAEIVNNGKKDVTFSAVPGMTMSSATALRGSRKCELNVLRPAGTSRGWINLPIYGTSKDNVVRLPETAGKQTLPAQSVWIFAYTCG